MIGRNGWAGHWLESYFRELNTDDPVTNGEAVVSAFVQAARPYVGTDLCKLPATLPVTVTGVRSDPNRTVIDEVSRTVDTAVRNLTNGLWDTVQKGSVLAAILAVILLGAAYLFREPAAALLAARGRLTP